MSASTIAALAALAGVLIQAAEAANRIKQAAEEGRELSPQEFADLGDQLEATAQRLRAFLPPAGSA